MPSDMSKLRVWIDIFFNDQNAIDILLELAVAEMVYKEARWHIVVATSGVLRRAWCLYELLIRREAGCASAMNPVYGSDNDSIEASGSYFEEMEAFDESDKIKIKDRILEVCGSAEEFNKGVPMRGVKFTSNHCDLLGYILISWIAVLCVLVFLCLVFLAYLVAACVSCMPCQTEAEDHENGGYKRLE